MEPIMTILPEWKPDRKLEFESYKSQSCKYVSIFPAQCLGVSLGTEEPPKMCDGAVPVGDAPLESSTEQDSPLGIRNTSTAIPNHGHG